MSDVSKEAYIALQMACELRQIITDEMGGMPALDLAPNVFPLPPLDGETFEDACRRIFGDYIFTRVMQERIPPEEKYPEKYYKNFEPKGPPDSWLSVKEEVKEEEEGDEDESEESEEDEEGDPWDEEDEEAEEEVEEEEDGEEEI